MKCFFFDRDGVVNVSPGPGAYVTAWNQFHLMPGFVKVLRRVRAAGYGAVVVTNQRAVALGLMTEQTVQDIHRRLGLLLREYDLDLLDILCCPHDEGQCDCRKPQPGMLLEAKRRHGIEMESSWMVGDSERDIEAGRRAGCRTILIEARRPASTADYVVGDMTALYSLIADHLLDT